MLTQEVSEVDRLLIISELKHAIQSLVTDQSINVEFDVEDNGNEKVLTITTTSTLPETEMVEEEPTEEVQEEEKSEDNGGGGGSDPEPVPEPEPPVEPEPPGEIIPAPPFG
jgi:hypothetical protein